MTATTPTHVDTSIPEIWAKETLRKVKVGGFWGRFTGGPGSPIVQKSELLNKPGDLIHVQVTDVLAGAGVTEQTILEGSEENLATSEIKGSPLLYRHGVRVYERADKKSIVNLREECRFRLEEWLMAKTDAVRFTQFAGVTMPSPLGSEAYTPNIFVVNGGTTVNDVQAIDDLSVASIQALKLKMLIQNAKPLDIDGFPHYVLVTHPYTTYQLKQEARYESWVREAQVRGESNPFFRGALAVIDGVIIYEHVSVPLLTNTVPIQMSKGICFGKEFAIETLDENSSFREALFDYQNEYGMAIRVAMQPRRALELSSTQVYATAEVV